MYHYNDQDQRLVEQRVVQFRDQTRRFLQGELSEEEFRPLRLMNGLYLQRHAPMLRVAIPYGLLSARQLRGLAGIAERWDRGYGHFTTRQNIQFNWPALEDVPDILERLATFQMHAIQTSGSCIRNTTTDHLAGVMEDELEDPRPWCELIRQWSTLHPEFSFLPRKFKIAVTGARQDRAATRVHDIGVQIIDYRGQRGFRILVGGGLGRTPVLGRILREFLPREQLLGYLEAILRIYNLQGRRDNKYKARIKILVNAIGLESFAAMVEDEWKKIQASGMTPARPKVQELKSHFTPPDYIPDPAGQDEVNRKLTVSPAFSAWYNHNTLPHRQPGYRIVTVSLKAPDHAPGDISAGQMRGIADLADRYSFGQIRVSHEQNLVLADVTAASTHDLWKALDRLDLATPNIGTLTDVICCPGRDFCSLANASSIPVAREIAARFDDLDYLYELGDIKVKISGCMNACGHHHIGHIGILGVDKKGEEYYQITLGGNAENEARLGKIIGPAIARDRVTEVIGVILETYVTCREENEPFIETVHRLGLAPFRDAVYGQQD